MRKCLAFIAALLSFVLFVGCGIEGDLFESRYKPDEKIDLSDDPDPHPWAVSYNISIDLETYLIEEDAEAIAELFCDAISMDEQQVQGLLDFIDGDIKYYDHQALQSGIKELRNGIYTQYTYAGWTHLYTNRDKEYIVYYSGVVTWEGNPNEIGLGNLKIVDAEDENLFYSLGYGAE